MASFVLVPAGQLATESDLAVVGVLSNAAISDSVGVVHIWSASLPVEARVFGSAEAGDTLRFFWNWPKPGYGISTLYDYEYYIGQRCLWLLRFRDEGGVRATRPGSLVRLDSLYETQGKLEELRSSSGELFVDQRVRLIEAYLSGYLDGRRAQSR